MEAATDFDRTDAAPLLPDVFARWFAGTLAFTAHMLGEGRLYSFAAKRCLPD